MTSEKSYKKRITEKWINRLGVDEYHFWLLPALQRFAQGLKIGMNNGADVRGGDLPTSQNEHEGYKQLKLFREAMKDFDWLFLGYEEKVPV